MSYYLQVITNCSNCIFLLIKPSLSIEKQDNVYFCNHPDNKKQLDKDTEKENIIVPIICPLKKSRLIDIGNRYIKINIK